MNSCRFNFKPPSERFVAFLDILGFAEMIETEPIEKIMGELHNAIHSVQLSEHLNTLAHDPQTKSLRLESRAKCLETFSFSDSFVLCSQDSSLASFRQILAGTFFLTRSLFVSGLPVRGAITCGEVSCIPCTNHMAGKAIIRAARLEKKQNWFGVIIDSACLTIERLEFLNNLEMRVAYVPYPVPLKDQDEPSAQLFALNWRYRLLIERGTASLFRNSEKREHFVKQANTLAFAKYVRNQGLAYARIIKSNGKEVDEPWLNGFVVSQHPPGTPGIKHGDEF